jgi:hypothetical protein
MSETFTDHDLRDQVTASLTGDAADFDVPGIVDEIQAAYGTVPIDQVPHAVYWGIVERHDHSLASYDITERHETNQERWNANHI